MNYKLLCNDRLALVSQIAMMAQVAPLRNATILSVLFRDLVRDGETDSHASLSPQRRKRLAGSVPLQQSQLTTQRTQHKLPLHSACPTHWLRPRRQHASV